MTHEFPNRLQETRYKRLRHRLLAHVSLIVLALAAIALGGPHALAVGPAGSAGPYSPPEWTAGTFPAGFTSHFDCSGTKCANRVWAPCTVSGVSYSCFLAGNSADGHPSLSNTFYPGSLCTNNAAFTAAGLNYVAYYNGTAWAFTNNTGADSIKFNDNVQTKIATNVDFYTNADTGTSGPDSWDNGSFCSAFYRSHYPNYNFSATCITTASYPRDSCDTLAANFTAIDPTATLTVSGSLVVDIGQKVEFHVAWNHQPFIPYYAYFYEDVNDDNAYATELIGDSALQTASGGYMTFQFYRSFQSPSGNNQSYHPMVRLGTQQCTTLTASGCTLFNAISGSGVLVKDPSTYSQDVQYPSTFTSARYRDVVVGQPVTMTYNLTAPCTITGKRLFMGYNPALARSDSGALLASGTSGTHQVIFPRTNQPYSDFVYPYINVYCSDGTSRQLYLGGSWYAAKAANISLYTQAQLNARSDSQTEYLNGGQSSDFSNTAGSSFKSDKRVYARTEPVLFELNYHVSFVPAQVLLFPTGTGSAGFNFGTGANVLKSGYYNYMRYSYDVGGYYQPVARVISSNPAVFVNIFLGGNAYPQPWNQLYISSDLWGSIAGLFSTKDGIFGLDPSTFAINIGTGSNQFLQDAVSGLSKIISAGLYVVNGGYNLLKASPLYSFFFDIVHPPNNSSYVFPRTLFDFPLPYGPADGIYTVTYADPASGSRFLEYIIKALVASALIRFAVRSFFA